MEPANGLTGREICKQIKENGLMDIPLWKPDNDVQFIVYNTLIKDAEDVNVLNGTATHVTGRIDD